MGNGKTKSFALWPWGLLGCCILCSGAVFRWQESQAGASPKACAKPSQQDGMLLCDGTGAPLRGQAWLVGSTLDVNRASRQNLEALPKIGPAIAEAIIAFRDSRGGFQSLEELREVSGIGNKTYLRIRPYLHVGRKRMLHRP